MVKQKFFPNMSEKTAHSDDKNFGQITQYLKDAQLSHKRVIPPLQDWHPKHCGKMDLVIMANGEWWHEGQKIERQSLIDLFSSVLWAEGDKFYLKTPVEKIEIVVEDAPLQINRVDQLEIDGKTYLQLMTPQQDVVIVDEQHSIFFQNYQGEQRPYAHVRFGLNALIQRACFYHLIEYGTLFESTQGETELHLQSGDYCLHFSV
ncbi:DUF1285 domain-containing protein [Acinetobacter sp. MD2]|uniref:DUF1285 domain-containing protein n=1 Tax=Acinetobacter sp. MD2 TaxID=2600066 RepID=UPI002D1F95AC|nr:DUF1285 domain-containing protein [Acinetobacter sp. MD2]MEB3767022.1 DUF1285 domain-containing protein [Acinetobacter sp. MD2]